jgi:hypothetical protein
MKAFAIIFVLISLFFLSTISNAQTISKKPAGFHHLPLKQQRTITDALAPPPICERDNPYSTPMYYLLAKGYRDGVGSMSDGGNLVLDRNRPDLQEELIKDWADMGMTSTHFLTYPSQWQSAESIQAIKDYFDISEKYGLKVGFRLGGDKTFGGLEASGWDLHPNNPENRIIEYVDWTKRVAKMGKGKVAYYVLGDELNLGGWEGPTGNAGETVHYKAEADRKWTPEVYMQVFPLLAQAIKDIDPDVKISMLAWAAWIGTISRACLMPAMRNMQMAWPPTLPTAPRKRLQNL